MANRKIMLPQYGTVMKRGVLYYRTRIKDANGKLVALYAKTPEELYNKETLALEQIENATFHRKTPTVAEYCEKWLLMQSVHVRATTLTDYTSKVRRHIIAELGDKRMGEVSLDDIQLALVPVSKKSTSVYKSVVILYKSIFRAAMESRIIDHISVDIFSDEYLDKINAIQLPNTKIKVLQRLLSQAIDEYKKVNRIMGMEFSDRLKRVVDEYNNRRRDEAFANEVLDDVAEQLAKLLEELKKEKDSFKGMGIDYEEKAFYDILKAVAKKYEFEYPDDKMIELSKRIKVIVDDKAKYTDWSTRDDIKANLQVDLILLLDEFDYPPVTIDDVYKEVLEQAENFKKYSE